MSCKPRRARFDADPVTEVLSSSSPASSTSSLAPSPGSSTPPPLPNVALISPPHSPNLPYSSPLHPRFYTPIPQPHLRVYTHTIPQPHPLPYIPPASPTSPTPGVYIHPALSDSSYIAATRLQRDVQLWLSAPDPWANHNVARKINHNGTATWFTQGTTFNDWKKRSTGSVLWIHGIPGSGKTVFCSTIIQDIWSMSSTESLNLAFFYFDHREYRQAGFPQLPIFPARSTLQSIRSFI